MIYENYICRQPQDQDTHVAAPSLLWARSIPSATLTIMGDGGRGDPWHNIIPRVTEPTPNKDHDAAVRSLLRWARDARVGVDVVGVLCAALGLDLDAALRRAVSI